MGLGAALAFAQVKINLDDPKPAASKAAPKKDEKKKDDGKAKKADEMGKITGIEIPRGSGFMGIELVNGTFKLSFYDAKKKPVEPDVDRAALKWNVKTQSLPERVILNRDGNALTNPKVIKPPYTFSLAITLFRGEGDAATTENFSVAFTQ